MKYLIIPSVPTPNGRLHLGHIGGPFLRADIIARERKRAGHDAVIISGTDSYESYVTHQAFKEQSTPDAICRHYHPLIAADLKAMSIDVHTFIDPLNDQWKTTYYNWHNRIFNDIVSRGGLTKISEKVLYDQNKNIFLEGCWLKGDCPACGIRTESYFCEHCGAYFRPEEVNSNKNNLLLKTVDHLFLKVPEYTTHYHLNRLYQQTIRSQNGLMRLTTNSSWGLTFSDRFTFFPKGTTIFNYGLMQAYFLMMGEIFNKKQNAFDCNSNVTTIACFGLDNTVPFLASSLGITKFCKEFKAFDYYIANHFYYLDNEKFSKSKRHAIFVNDIVQNKVSCDVVRLYLASIDVTKRFGKFSRTKFIQFYNETLKWIENDIIKLLARTQYRQDPYFLTETLNYLLDIQAKLLHPGQFSPAKATETIYIWLKFKKDNVAWLKGLALLIYPFMPNLSQSIWHHLGLSYTPQQYNCERPILNQNSFSYDYKKLTIEDLHAKKLQY